jgi:hypothetical protein
MCLDPGATNPQTIDAAIPEVDKGYWYLVRGRHTCGPGTWGWALNQETPAERHVNACP